MDLLPVLRTWESSLNKLKETPIVLSSKIEDYFNNFFEKDKLYLEFIKSNAELVIYTRAFKESFSPEEMFPLLENLSVIEKIYPRL